MTDAEGIDISTVTSRAKPTCALSPLQQEHVDAGHEINLKRFGAKRQKQLVARLAIQQIKHMAKQADH
jgi:hypothetical protein